LEYCFPISHIPAVRRTVPPGRQNQKIAIKRGREDNDANVLFELKFF